LSDESIDDIDEEIARIEEQIEQLEEGRLPDEEGDVEAPEPEEIDAGGPEPEEALDDDADIEAKESRLEGLMNKLGNLRERRTDEQDDETDEGADEAEDDEGGLFAGLGSSDEPDDEEPVEEDEPTDEEASPSEEEATEDDDGGLFSGFGSSEEDDETDDSSGGFFSGFGSSDEEDEASVDEETGDTENDTEASDDEDPEEPARASDEDDGDEPGAFAEFADDDADKAEEDEEDDGESAFAGFADEDEADAKDEPADEDDPERASALLSRYREADETEEDEDDKRRPILAVLLVLLLAGAIVAGVLWYLDDSDEPAPSAQLSSDAFREGGDGAYVATTGSTVGFEIDPGEATVNSYTWRFGDGNSETTGQPRTSHTYASRGLYTLTVTVSGPGGENETTSEVRIVDAPTADPQILLGGNPVSGPDDAANVPFVGQPVILDGTGSTADPSQELTSYTWDTNGDGEPDATSREAEISFDEAGRWQVDLTVRDGLGLSGTATTSVDIAERADFNGTVGPEPENSPTAEHPVAVDPGRGDVEPTRMVVQLTYNASSTEGGDLLEGQVEANLDVNATDPEGNTFTAEDDSGEGNESLVVEGDDLVNLGEWIVGIEQDQSGTGAASEAEYELRVELYY